MPTCNTDQHVPPCELPPPSPAVPHQGHPCQTPPDETKHSEAWLSLPQTRPEPGLTEPDLPPGSGLAGKDPNSQRVSITWWRPQFCSSGKSRPPPRAAGDAGGELKLRWRITPTLLRAMTPHHTHTFLLLTASITPRERNGGAQAAPEPHSLPLSQWGSLQKQRRAPSEGQEGALWGSDRGAEARARRQPYLPTPNQGALRGSTLPPSSLCTAFFFFFFFTLKKTPKQQTKLPTQKLSCNGG